MVLNVKKLRLKSYAPHPVQLRAAQVGRRPGHRRTTSSRTADVEIVNPDQHLLTLDSDDVTIEIDMTVERGVGYLAAERSEQLPIGVIPVDAIFSPVRKVNYTVENTRVGQMTNYDKLTIEIETDGTLTPEEALSRAAEILVGQFSLFTTAGKTLVAGERGVVGAPSPAAEHARHAHRGARPADAGLQLAEAQQHRQGRPAAAAPGRGPAADAQLRQEVARRDEGAPAHARLPAARRRHATAPTSTPRTSSTTLTSDEDEE